MALTPYEDLLPFIQPQAAAAPIDMILSITRRVVTDFCLRSTAYRHRITGMASVAGQAYYTLTTPANTSAAGILIATYDGQALEPSSDVLVAHSAAGTPHAFIFESGQARIIGTPSISLANAFEFLLYLRPTMSATGIDSSFLDDYYHDISVGVLAELLSMSNQPWSNPQLAAQYNVQYNMGVDNAKSRANADHTAKVRTTRINWL